VDTEDLDRSQKSEKFSEDGIEYFGFIVILKERQVRLFYPVNTIIYLLDWNRFVWLMHILNFLDWMCAC
jgi:hypothetical protein